MKRLISLVVLTWFANVTVAAPLDEPTAVLKQVAKHQFSVNVLTFSPDGTKLYSGCAGGIIQITDTAAGKVIRTFDAHLAKKQDIDNWNGPPTGVLAFAVSKDGSTLYSGGSDSCLSAWNVRTGAVKVLLRDHFVAALALSPDGSTLASTGYNRAIRLISLTDKAPVREILGPSERVTGATFSPDGRTLFTGGVTANLTFRNCPVIESEKFRAWDVSTDEEEWSGAGKAHRLEISADGRTLLTSGAIMRLDTGPNVHGAIRLGDTAINVEYVSQLWDRQTGKRLWTLFGHGSYAIRSGDARYLAIAPTAGNYLEVGIEAGNSVGERYDQAKVSVMDLSDGQLVFQPYLDRPTSLAFSPDNMLLAIGNAGGEVFLLDLRAQSRNRLRPRTQDELWTQLADARSDVCYRSMWSITVGGKRSIPFLETKLLLPATLDENAIRKHIAELDDDDFDKREAALAALQRVGLPALHLVKQATAAKPTPEAARRMAEFLKQYADVSGRAPPEIRRLQRAITILEDMDTPESRDLLQRVAGERGILPVRDLAKQSLLRMKSPCPVPYRVER
jgi:WD40 repeat protein